MISKDEIARQFKKHKKITVAGLGDQWENTRKCQAFYDADYMEYIDSISATDIRGRKTQKMVQFGLVKPYVNCVRGFMAQNRGNADYVARVQNDQAQQMYSEWANSFKESIREGANADQVETQQDGDMLIAGYGAVETAMSYGDGYSSRNPNGEVIMGRLDPRIIGWDPTARESNLLDARWCYYYKTYDIEEAKSLFDDQNEEDFESANNDDVGGKQWFPDGGRYNKIQEIYDTVGEDEDLVKVYFYQWYEIEKFYRAKNPVRDMADPQQRAYFDMQLQEIAAEDDADELYKLDPRADIITCTSKTKKAVVEVFDDAVDFISENRRVYYTAVLSGTKVFTSYRSACQTGFTIKFKTGDYNETHKMWVGMVNSMMDPVLYYNKALTELMFIIASQAKGGVYVERGAVDSISDFEQKYAKTNAVIEVDEGAISGNKIMAKKESPSMGGLDGILQISSDALPMVTGIDRNFLGSSENKQETAALQRQRIKQVTTALATYFDNISLYQKEYSRMLIPFMRILAENNDGSMFKSMSSDGDIQYLQISPDNLVDEYDILIQEAPDTATQKEERAELFSTMATMLISVQDIQTAKQVMALGAKYWPIESTDQQKLVEILIPDQQQIDPQQFAALQQQVQELSSEHSKAELARTMSEASLNQVKAEQGISDIKNKNADTGKKVAETKKTNVETQLAKSTPVKSTNVVL